MSDPVGPYDDLVLRLRSLRDDAGVPSFGDIAVSVSRVRRERGLSPERARVGRTTVYDAFRLGRQRIDADLIGDIVRALGQDEQTARAWTREAHRARSAASAAAVLVHTEVQVEVPDPVPDEVPDPVPDVVPDVVPDPVPDPVPTATWRPSGPWTAAVLAGCLVVNLLGRTTVDVLGLPVYLDMVGTALAAVLLGPWWGAGVGLATNAAGVVPSGLDSLLFAPVNVVGALVWGYGARHLGLARTIPRFFGLNVLAALACSAVAVPLIVIASGGVSEHASDTVVASVRTVVGSLWAGVLVANVLVSLVDKLICGFVVLTVLEMLPPPVRSALVPDWLAGPPPPREDGDPGRSDELVVRDCSG
jgi:energy-coupling factor transport system substrate-specific component